MSREIKFRAIEVETGQQLLWNAYFDIDNDGVVYRVDYDNEREVVSVMYTGLKDRNGKEIYEGDIVKTNGVDGELLWQVVWSELDVLTGFDYEPVNHSWSSVHNNVDGTGEIIGNIYSNPELLEATND